MRYCPYPSCEGVNKLEEVLVSSSRWSKIHLPVFPRIGSGASVLVRLRLTDVLGDGICAGGTRGGYLLNHLGKPFTSECSGNESL